MAVGFDKRKRQVRQVKEIGDKLSSLDGGVASWGSSRGGKSPPSASLCEALNTGELAKTNKISENKRNKRTINKELRKVTRKRKLRSSGGSRLV